MAMEVSFCGLHEAIAECVANYGRGTTSQGVGPLPYEMGNGGNG